MNNFAYKFIPTTDTKNFIRAKKQAARRVLAHQSWRLYDKPS